MRDLGFLAILLCILTGCATTKESAKEDFAARYERLAAQQTPASWKAHSSWAFVAMNKTGQIDHSVVFRVTEQPADACLSGNWKKLEVIAESSPKTLHPAYLLEGRNLSILLSTALCDAYNGYRGSLDKNGFTGVHESSGLLGGEEHGSVTGTPVTP